MKEVPADDTIYHEGTFRRGKVSLKVVAAAALEMGMPAATALSMKMIYQFRPKYLAMLGITAGVTGSFGDILVAEMGWDYQSGKTKPGSSPDRRFAPDPHPIQLDTRLKARVSLFKGRTDILENIRRGWAGGGVAHRPSVLMGPLASGASVVQDPQVVKELLEKNRKLVGLEMETYGVYLAARMCSNPRPLAISMKSICDFADPAKADDYQRYAAYTSANFFHEFALTMLGTAEF